MKVAIALIAICLVAALFVSSGFLNISFGVPGSGQIESESRDVESFDKISLVETGTINVSYGETFSVILTTDDNLLELIETKVEDGELKIRPSKTISPTNDLVIDITLPELSQVDLAGAATLNLVEIQSESLEISLAGACSVSGSGKIANLSVDMAGACRARLSELESENATVEIAGTGSAVVFASKKIDATASGWASITCHGNPEEIQKEENGMSSVTIKK